MATAFRSSALRQAFAAVPAQRAFSTSIASSVPAFRLARQQPLVRSAFAQTPSRVAAFHASPARAILPPLPQVIKGTVNDPVHVHDPSPVHGSYHWSFERFMSAALIPLTIAPFVGGSLNPVTDAILCATLIVHSHIGFESCIIDYFPTYRMPGVQKALMWLLKAVTVLVGIGFYEFETNDVGLTAAIAKIWTS